MNTLSHTKLLHVVLKKEELFRHPKSMSPHELSVRSQTLVSQSMPCVDRDSLKSKQLYAWTFALIQTRAPKYPLL